MKYFVAQQRATLDVVVRFVYIGSSRPKGAVLSFESYKKALEFVKHLNRRFRNKADYGKKNLYLYLRGNLTK